MRGWPWTLVLVFYASPDDFDQDKDGDDAFHTVDYAVELRLAYRSKEHCMDNTSKDREQCVKVSVGEINLATGNFSAWATRAALTKEERRNRVDKRLSPPRKALFCVMLGDTQHVHQLFYQANWPLTESVDNAESRDEADLGLGPARSRLRYTFEVVDDSLCYLWKTPQGEKEEWVKIANFYIVKILALYQPLDSQHKPFIKVLTRCLVNEAGYGSCYLTTDEEERSPNLGGMKYLDVEVLLDLSKLRSQSDVASAFQCTQVMLLASNMTFDHLATYLLMFDLPEPSKAITRFGRQLDGTFVAGNCAFGSGELMTHDEAKVAIVPMFFEDAIVPLPRSEYPRHVLIPYAHVRYMIGMNAWLNLMPSFFQNNLMPAKAVFALSVMGLHCHQIWNGQSGVGHGHPFGWIFSTEPSTGKTEACLLAHSMLGMFHRGLWAGSATHPALMERLSDQSGLTLFVDDVVINASHPESKAYSQLGRALFDRTSRAVSGKIRMPFSSAAFTANGTINNDDAAYMSRELRIQFDALTARSEDDDPDLYNQWTLNRELMSALTVDFEAMTMNGKLDRCAIQDCASFLQQALGKKRDRNANLYVTPFPKPPCQPRTPQSAPSLHQHLPGVSSCSNSTCACRCSRRRLRPLPLHLPSPSLPYRYRMVAKIELSQ